MKRVLLACLVAALAAGGAVAQQPQIAPQVRAQLPAQQMLQPTPRQRQLLQAAGVPAERPTLRAPTTLSVRQPVAEQASLSFTRVREYTPTQDATGMAYMEGQWNNPGYVSIGFRADATSRYIVDCAVYGRNEVDYKFIRRVRVPTGFRDDETLAAVTNGRVGIVLQPLGEAGQQSLRLQGNGRTSSSWQFYSCQITPVS